MNYSRVLLAGTHSGVGKTTVVLGIELALKKIGINVQPFKVGPDYIDPTYHREITGNICYNLDSWLLSKNTILELFKKHAGSADISVIEGVMGLYDGAENKEKGSTSHLAKILKCPVILIVDAHSLSRSAGALVLGYKEFDRKLNIRGVILNNIGSISHYHYVKNTIEINTGVKVFGFLPVCPELKLPERHLGLIPAGEKKLLSVFKKKLLSLVEKNINLKEIIKISNRAEKLPRSDMPMAGARLGTQKPQIFNVKHVKHNVFIGIARDKAFNFYYEDNLDILKSLGARLIEFSPLEDKELPKNIDGLYIGGGFPELFAGSLSKNIKLKEQIHKKAKENLPIYAECGGLMYLVEKLIDFKKIEFPMVGIFKGRVIMANKIQALGYVELETIRENILSKKGDKNKAHVFHWSYLDGIPRNLSFAYKIRKNKNIIFYDGLIEKNVLAGYVHFHFASNINFAKNFILSCKKYRDMSENVC